MKDLKPWRDLITPHDSVLKGTFQESEFAADLNKVVNKTATPEYQKPALFFERTYITEGMRIMLESVAKRMLGQGGDPVVQLQTAFGGGKTHAMLAVYHMAKGEEPAEGLPGIYSVLSAIGIDYLPAANIAVLDGNNLSPSEPRTVDGLTINTLWGEIAWQLGGKDGYLMLERADRDGTSPGKEILAQLFKKFSPAIVLMDETVAYVRQFSDEKQYSGGTFGSNLAFLQALTEAAGHVPNAMVIASLPESDLEVGGEQGRKTLKQIEHLFHRLETIWKPVSAKESFEIVRRRIFSELKDYKSKEIVCKAFADMYIEDSCYPSETKESRYFDRLMASYPVHPEVFDRLYEDWATMENFQRTRGVLRLMAMVVHRLWADGNKDLMIMPGSFPLRDNQLRNELIRYLPAGWDPVVDRDVDGDRSVTFSIDQNDPRFGTIGAARAVARAIFMGSAPSTGGQRIRGINAEHVRLGCTQPGQSLGVYDDALRRLNDKLHYLYAGQDRYWLDTQTNLRREAEDRMSRFSMKEHILPEIGERLRKLLKGRPFGGIHVFANHADVPDDQQVRLVVLPPVASHLWKQKNTGAIKEAKEMLTNRGRQPRLNQNRLIFLCADEDTKIALYDQAKRYLAWKSILDDKAALNLDQHRIKEATGNQQDYNGRLDGSIVETFKWLLAPYQEETGKGGITELDWEAQKITANGNMISAIARVLEENELLISEWSPVHLKNELKLWYFKGGRVSCKLLTLWEDFCRYPYLPRLVDSTVLQKTVLNGVATTDFFGYAAGMENDKYLGVLFGSTGSVYIDTASLLLHPDEAKQCLERKGDEGDKGDGSSATGPATTITGVVETREKPGGFKIEPKIQSKKRFYGTVKLNPINASLAFSDINQEVLQHFTSKAGASVSITLEIEVQDPKGFGDATCRTVQENCKTLGFQNAEFEEE